MTKLILGSSALFGAYLVAKLFQPRFNKWGSTSEEHSRRFPGEQFLKDRTIVSTHAITIDAPPSQIWPWLVQVGVGRGGFYSYAWLENLVGCGVKNVETLVPELQDLKVGDEITLHPKAPKLRVTHLEPNRALALDGWMFLLEPVGARQTRLISRTYAIPREPNETLPMKIMNGALSTVGYELAHFIMQRKQLKEIKRLVESAASSRAQVQSATAAARVPR